MTPLAMRFAKQLVLPVKDRTIGQIHLKFLRGALNDIHCFDVTEIHPAVNELRRAISKKPEQRREGSFARNLAFLPAPKTWIESFNVDAKRRIAFLIEKAPGTNWGTVILFTDDLSGSFWRILGDIFLDTEEWYGGDVVRLPDQDKNFKQDDAAGLFYLYYILALINSPKIIGRRQHMPHAGLERSLLKNRGMIGKFPLHAWTEIKLVVNKPPEIDDGEPHESHLTGRRALHFVRKHLRIRLGRLEYVSAHWRGDPAIGFKQSRYIVTTEKHHEQSPEPVG